MMPFAPGGFFHESTFGVSPGEADNMETTTNSFSMQKLGTGTSNLLVPGDEAA
eukprot:CAMPEP_0181323940 /NCGR_PEP_ID=MMETSP1101-20121128/20072_1 /TAXON_ID=46948 /ORGANISM="Rhodomonas abbreviata, Strain Caron Lab Isolate" /LENGTH=52 /DNA_ID=CAMNT_0023432039 /DNA_START=48 /DNA_END=206 /DNA_ORIENTATION=+